MPKSSSATNLLTKNNPKEKLSKIVTFLFSSKKRKVITIIICLLLAFFTWKTFAKSNSNPQYQTATITRGTIISSVTESGNVTTTSQGGIGSPTTGIIEALYVKDGDKVSVGQNLFKVKSTATAQEVASAYSSLLTAQNTLNSAKAKLNSLQEAMFVANQTFINDKGVPNPSAQQIADPKYVEENAAWLQSQADYLNQQGVINQAQAALNNAELAYQATQDSVVTAPISGIIANISVQPGDQVIVSNSNLVSPTTTSTATTILSIGNFSNPYIKVAASEVDIPNIKTGEKATITLNSFPNKTFVGKVQQVDTVGTVSSGVVTYNVYVGFVAPPPGIEPGMSATVTIETARHDNVLMVPSAAIQNNNDQTTVRILQNGQITNIPVTTGISSDTDTEITSGLSEGENVVTGITLPNTTSETSTSPFSGTRGFGGGGGALFRGGGTRGG